MRLPRALVLPSALCLAPAPLAAQAPDDPPPAIEVELIGTALVNAFYDGGAVNNSDVPQFVLPAPPDDGLPDHALGAAVRQTRLQLLAHVPELAGGTLAGKLDVDFFGGQQPSSGGRTFPLPRIRRAFAELQWSRVTLLVGQESPPIASVSPSSLASIGFPGFASAGNLWLWLPQVRVTGELPAGGPLRLGLEVAALAPTSGEAQAPFFTTPDRAERSGRPFLQARALARWGEDEQAAEVSVGGHYGWLAGRDGGEPIASKAAAIAAWVPFASRFELRGEAFIGEALAGLGGGGIGQSLGVGERAVRTRGGWLQLNAHVVPQLELGAGAGIDDPDDADLDPATARLRNVVVEGHATWRLRPLVLGAEVRELRTSYAAPIGSRRALHVNVAAGIEW